MAASNSKWSEAAGRLQARFLATAEADVESYDPRDLGKVRGDLKYVCKYIRHMSGDEERAYNMMVEALKWRKSFGTNDLDETCVNQKMVEKGLAFPHGIDRDGNIIVILNVRLHKKDLFPTTQLHQFVVYCLENHIKLYPERRVTMIFDMSETGLSNMDLDFIKFFVTCFKQYYPDLLAYLLVFELPWILQAAWRIIKSWLSERAVKKIKFVGKSDISTYIEPEQLMLRYGGTDPWVFDPATITDSMRAMAEQLATTSGDGQPGAISAEVSNMLGRLEMSVKEAQAGEVPRQVQESEAIEEATMVSPSVDSNKKQVRFSADVKPTPPNRTRYTGNQSEKMRVRQVEKFLGLRPPPHHNETDSVGGLNTMETDGDIETNAIAGSLVLLQQQEEENGSNSNHTRLEISPYKIVVFSQNTEGMYSCALKLTNYHDVVMAFKVKTTAPTRYKVKPSLGYVTPGGQADILLRIIPGMESQFHSISDDKFLVQYCPTEFVPSGHIKQSVLATQWKKLPRNKIGEHLMKCSIETVEVPVTTKQPETPPIATPTSSLQLSSLQQQVTELVCTCNRLQRTTSLLLWFQLLTVTAMVVVIVTYFLL